jgi:hypothetical protein
VDTTPKKGKAMKPAALTKGNLDKMPNAELSTSEKIAALTKKMADFKNDKLDANAFTPEEKRCLWNKFHAAKQMNCEAASKWDALPTVGRGNQNLKNAFLWAWLKDPTWGKHFMERVNTLSVKQTHEKSMKWLTYKQLCDKHGKEEADELIKTKSILMRPNPKNNQFFQFLDEDEEYQFTNEKKKDLHATQKGDIKAKSFKKLCFALGTASTADVEDLHEQPDFPGTDSGDEEDNEADDGNNLPASLKKLMGCKKKANKKQGSSGSKGNKEDNKEVVDEINRTCSVLGSDVKATVLGKANKMHSLLAKVYEGLDDKEKQSQAWNFRPLNSDRNVEAENLKQELSA